MPQTRESSLPQPYRVLIVDDEPLMLEGLRLMIHWQEHGFDLCGEALNAAQARRRFAEIKPDLLITDIRLPDESGIELAASLVREHPELCVIYFSGYQEFPFIQSAIQLKAVGYLLKPIDPQEVHPLLIQARQRLDSRRPAPLDEHVLRRIASGDQSAAAREQAARLLGLEPTGVYRCAVLQHEALPDTLNRGAERLVPFRLSAGRWGLLLCGEDLRALRELHAETGLCIGVGRAAQGTEGFCQSLREACDALDALFVAEDGLRMYQPYPREALASLYAQGVVPMLLDIIREDDAAARRLMDELCGLLRRANASVLEIRLMLRRAEPTLRIALGQGQPLEIASLGDESVCTPEEMLRRAEEALWRMRGQARANQPPLPSTVAFALRQIQERYADDLTLGQLAGELHINQAYLGQLIRQHTGQTFLQHLLERRMRQAQLLLCHTNLPIQEIAARVGMRDENYFTFKFRSLFSVSPSAYRAARREGGDGA